MLKIRTIFSRRSSARRSSSASQHPITSDFLQEKTFSNPIMTSRPPPIPGFLPVANTKCPERNRGDTNTMTPAASAHQYSEFFPCDTLATSRQTCKHVGTEPSDRAVTEESQRSKLVTLSPNTLSPLPSRASLAEAIGTLLKETSSNLNIPNVFNVFKPCAELPIAVAEFKVDSKSTTVRPVSPHYPPRQFNIPQTFSRPAPLSQQHFSTTESPFVTHRNSPRTHSKENRQHHGGSLPVSQGERASSSQRSEMRSLHGPALSKQGDLTENYNDEPLFEGILGTMKYITSNVGSWVSTTLFAPELPGPSQGLQGEYLCVGSSGDKSYNSQTRVRSTNSTGSRFHHSRNSRCNEHVRGLKKHAATRERNEPPPHNQSHHRLVQSRDETCSASSVGSHLRTSLPANASRFSQHELLTSTSHRRFDNCLAERSSSIAFQGERQLEPPRCDQDSRKAYTTQDCSAGVGNKTFPVKCFYHNNPLNRLPVITPKAVVSPVMVPSSGLAEAEDFQQPLSLDKRSKTLHSTSHQNQRQRCPDVPVCSEEQRYTTAVALDSETHDDEDDDASEEPPDDPNEALIMSRVFRSNFWRQKEIKPIKDQLPPSTLWQSFWHAIDPRTKAALEQRHINKVTRAGHAVVTRQKWNPELPNMTRFSWRCAAISHIELSLLSIENVPYIAQVVIDSGPFRIPTPFNCRFLRIPYFDENQIVTLWFNSPVGRSQRSVHDPVIGLGEGDNDWVGGANYDETNPANADEDALTEAELQRLVDLEIHPKSQTYFNAPPGYYTPANDFVTYFKFEIPVKALIAEGGIVEDAAAIDPKGHFYACNNERTPEENFNELRQAARTSVREPLVKFRAAVFLQGPARLIAVGDAPPSHILALPPAECSEEKPLLVEKLVYVALVNDPVDQLVGYELNREDQKLLKTVGPQAIRRVHSGKYMLNGLEVDVDIQTITPEQYWEFDFTWYPTVTGIDYACGKFKLPIVTCDGICQPINEFLRQSRNNQRILAVERSNRELEDIFFKYIASDQLPQISLDPVSATLPYEAQHDPNVVNALYRHGRAILINLSRMHYPPDQTDIRDHLTPPYIQLGPDELKTPVTFFWDTFDLSSVTIGRVDLTDPPYYLRHDYRFPYSSAKLNVSTPEITKSGISGCTPLTGAPHHMDAESAQCQEHVELRGPKHVTLHDDRESVMTAMESNCGNSSVSSDHCHVRRSPMDTKTKLPSRAPISTCLHTSRPCHIQATGSIITLNDEPAIAHQQHETSPRNGHSSLCPDSPPQQEDANRTEVHVHKKPQEFDQQHNGVDSMCSPMTMLYEPSAIPRVHPKRSLTTAQTASNGISEELTPSVPDAQSESATRQQQKRHHAQENRDVPSNPHTQKCLSVETSVSKGTKRSQLPRSRCQLRDGVHALKADPFGKTHTTKHTTQPFARNPVDPLQQNAHASVIKRAHNAAAVEQTRSSCAVSCAQASRIPQRQNASIAAVKQEPCVSSQYHEDHEQNILPTHIKASPHIPQLNLAVVKTPQCTLENTEAHSPNSLGSEISWQLTPLSQCDVIRPRNGATEKLLSTASISSANVTLNYSNTAQDALTSSLSPSPCLPWPDTADLDTAAESEHKAQTTQKSNDGTARSTASSTGVSTVSSNFSTPRDGIVWDANHKPKVRWKQGQPREIWEIQTTEEWVKFRQRILKEQKINKINRSRLTGAPLGYRFSFVSHEGQVIIPPDPPLPPIEFLEKMTYDQRRRLRQIRLQQVSQYLMRHYQEEWARSKTYKKVVGQLAAHGIER